MVRQGCQHVYHKRSLLAGRFTAAGIQERTGRESGETDRVMQCVKGQSARKEFRCVSLSPSRKLRIALTSAMMLFPKSIINLKIKEV